MKTIIDTATAAGNFTTLLGALKAAWLTDTLRTKGPYTVFAPRANASSGCSGFMNDMQQKVWRSSE